MTSRNDEQGGYGNFGGFGGLGDLEEQIFGRSGLLGQVLGGGQGPAPRGPFGGGFGPAGSRPGPGGDRRRARRGDVRNAVLHLLQREPMNGYQLMQEIAQSSGGAWQPSSGAIYPALSQLEDEGLAAQTEIEGRRAYQLTDAGRAAAESLPPQGWTGTDREPEDPWAQTTHGGRGEARSHSGGRGPGHGSRGGRGHGQSHRQQQYRSGGALWKSLGGVALAAQAVAQAGDPQLTRKAADLLDHTRRDLYRLLAEASVAAEDEARDFGDPDEVTEAEVLEED